MSGVQCICVFWCIFLQFCNWRKFSHDFMLYHRTLEPTSPSGPLGPPGACRQNDKTQTVKQVLKKQSWRRGYVGGEEINDILTLQSKEQHWKKKEKTDYEHIKAGKVSLYICVCEGRWPFWINLSRRHGMTLCLLLWSQVKCSLESTELNTTMFDSVVSVVTAKCSCSDSVGDTNEAGSWISLRSPLAFFMCSFVLPEAGRSSFPEYESVYREDRR